MELEEGQLCALIVNPALTPEGMALGFSFTGHYAGLLESPGLEPLARFIGGDLEVAVEVKDIAAIQPIAQ